MDCPIHINTLSMELSILYFKGLQVKISMKWGISVPEDCFFLSKHTVWQSTGLLVHVFRIEEG